MITVTNYNDGWPKRSGRSETARVPSERLAR